MKTLFLDGDMLAYRAAFSNEVETKWDDDVWTLQTDVQASLAYFDDFVEALCKKFNTDEYFVVFSPKTNFRYELFPEYKGNRKGKRKPLALSELITQVRKRHMFMMADNMEADDLIGIMCTQSPDTIAISGDKDFATLPITWYNFIRDETVTLTEEEANRNHLIQTLTGDATDGYAGLKGVGPKTAIKLLDKHGWDWEGVVKIYESKDMTEEDALLTARLAYILRKENIKEGKIVLWTPTRK
jgi:DNA polymerase-1